MIVYLLFLEDNTGWSHQTKSLQGVYASEERAAQDIPDWARNKMPRPSRFDSPGTVRLGSDGIDYVITPTEVKTS